MGKRGHKVVQDDIYQVCCFYSKRLTHLRTTVDEQALNTSCLCVCSIKSSSVIIISTEY